MESMRRRQARRDGDFVESLHLFRELLQTVGESIRSCYVRDTKNRQEKDTKTKQQKPVAEIRTISRVEEHPVEQPRAIGLRYDRDWEGLCSERKEDVLGEYAICFEYEINEEEEQKNMECEESDESNGGSLSDQ